jgi:hypothetical protein
MSIPIMVLYIVETLGPHPETPSSLQSSGRRMITSMQVVHKGHVFFRFNQSEEHSA